MLTLWWYLVALQASVTGAGGGQAKDSEEPRRDAEGRRRNRAQRRRRTCSDARQQTKLARAWCTACLLALTLSFLVLLESYGAVSTCVLMQGVLAAHGNAKRDAQVAGGAARYGFAFMHSAAYPQRSVMDALMPLANVVADVEYEDVNGWKVHSGLTKEQKAAVADCVSKHNGAFAHSEEDVVGYTGGAGPFTIDVTSDAPTAQRPRRMSAAEQAKIDEFYGDAEKCGWIERMPKDHPLYGKHGINTTVAAKKDAETGEWTDVRVCADSRPPNSITIRDKRTMPRVDEAMQKVANAKYISSLDLRKGFNQILMAEASKPYTQFWWKGELWCWTRMTYGYVNASAKFQDVMDYELAQAGLTEHTTCYVDDVLVFSDTLEEHLQVLHRFFAMLEKTGLRAHPKKCKFAAPTVEFLGHRVGGNGIGLEDAKVAAIKEMGDPETVTELRSQLGLITYYRDFLPAASEHTAAFRHLLKKGAKWEWGEKERQAMAALKDMLCRPGLGLHHFNPEFQTHVYTDFSRHGIAAVLAQIDDDGKERLVACISRSCTASEQNYPSFYGELLAVTWALRSFHPYVWGQHIKLITDHQPLQWLLSTRTTKSAHHLRWAIAIAEYDIEIIHRAGAAHANADVPSRHPRKTTDDATGAQLDPAQARDSLEGYRSRLLTPVEYEKFYAAAQAREKEAREYAERAAAERQSTQATLMAPQCYATWTSREQRHWHLCTEQLSSTPQAKQRAVEAMEEDNLYLVNQHSQVTPAQRRLLGRLMTSSPHKEQTRDGQARKEIKVVADAQMMRWVWALLANGWTIAELIVCATTAKQEAAVWKEAEAIRRAYPVTATWTRLVTTESAAEATRRAMQTEAALPTWALWRMHWGDVTTVGQVQEETKERTECLELLAKSSQLRYVMAAEHPQRLRALREQRTTGTIEWMERVSGAGVKLLEGKGMSLAWTNAFAAYAWRRAIRRHGRVQDKWQQAARYSDIDGDAEGTTENQAAAMPESLAICLHELLLTPEGDEQPEWLRWSHYQPKDDEWCEMQGWGKHRAAHEQQAGMRLQGDRRGLGWGDMGMAFAQQEMKGTPERPVAFTRRGLEEASATVEETVALAQLEEGLGSNDPWHDDAMRAELIGDAQGIQEEAVRRRARRRAKHYSMTKDEKGDAVLWRAWPNGRKVEVPAPERRAELIRKVHERTGHFGARRTYQLLAAMYWWPGMGKQVVEHVRNCPACDVAKARPAKEAGGRAELRPLPIGGLYWRWHLDYAVDLPETALGNRHLLIMVEAFSKDIIAVPTPDRTSATTANAFLQHVLCRYGAPAVVTTDNGVEFHGEMERLLREACIDHRWTSREHPQANGQAERAVQTIKGLLRRMAADKEESTEWDVLVHWACMGYRFSKHAATGFSPYELMHGEEPVLPAAARAVFGVELDLLTKEWDAVRADEVAAEVYRRALTIRERVATAAGNLKIAQHRDAGRYMKRRDGSYFRRLRRFRVGDFVYVAQAAPAALGPKVKRVILRVSKEREDGTFELMGKCGSVIVEHGSNMAPCHLTVAGSLDDRLARKRYECEECKRQVDTSTMLVCNGCGKAWHASCLVPPVKLLPKDGVWTCDACRAAGVKVVPPSSAGKGYVPPPTARAKLQEERGKALDGVMVRKEFAVDGSRKKKEFRGRVTFEPHEEPPYRFRVEYEDGDEELMSEAEVRRHMVLPTQNVQAAEEKLTTPEEWRACIEKYMPGIAAQTVTSLVRAVQAGHADPESLPVAPTGEAEVKELLRHVDLAQATGLVEPFVGTGIIAQSLRKVGLKMVTNDLNPRHGGQYSMDACQPSSWRVLGAHLGAKGAVVTSPWFNVLDLALPLMVEQAPVVCVHVPYSYVPSGGIARQAYLAQLACEGRLLLVMGLERQGNLRNCAWLCVFRNKELREQMVRTDVTADVGWFRLADAASA